MSGFVRDPHSAAIAVRVFDLVRQAKEKLLKDAEPDEVIEVLNEIVRILSRP